MLLIQMIFLIIARFTQLIKKELTELSDNDKLFFVMKSILMRAILLLLLISCRKGSVVFVCDEVYAETVVKPYRLERVVRRSSLTAGYAFRRLDIPINGVLSDALPSKAAVVLLSPFLAKQAQACAADRPETLFVTLEQKEQTPLPNLRGLPRKGEAAYADLGKLFGQLSREAIADPFAVRKTNAAVADNGAQKPAGDDDFPTEWQSPSAATDSTIVLKPAVVFANLSTEKEKNYLAFLNAFTAAGAQASFDLVSLDLPPSRDSASLDRLAQELQMRHCNLIFLDVGAATPQLIELLSAADVLLAVFPAPPDRSPMWKNIDLVLEWDYETAIEQFFSDLDADEPADIFLELKIKKYKRDSILFPHYAEKISDK